MSFNPLVSSENQKTAGESFCISQKEELVSTIADIDKNAFLFKNKKIEKDQSLIKRVEHESVDLRQFLAANISEEDIGVPGKGKKFLFKCSSGEKVLSIIIDTGSSTTLISKSLVSILNLKYYKSRLPVNFWGVFGNKLLADAQIASIAINIGGCSLAMPGYILEAMPLKCDVLIGTDQIGKQIGISLDLSNRYFISLFDSSNHIKSFELKEGGELSPIVNTVVNPATSLFDDNLSEPSSTEFVSVSEKHSPILLVSEDIDMVDCSVITSNILPSSESNVALSERVCLSGIGSSHVVYDKLVDDPTLLCIKIELENISVALKLLREELNLLHVPEENIPFISGRKSRSRFHQAQSNNNNLKNYRIKIVEMIDQLAKELKRLKNKYHLKKVRITSSILRKERKKGNRFISEVVASVVESGATYNHVFESDYYPLFRPRHEFDSISSADIIEFVVENKLFNHEHKKVDVDLVYSKLKKEVDSISSKVIKRESVSCLFLCEEETLDSTHGVKEPESREKLFSLIKDEIVSLVTVASEKVLEELPDTADWKGEFKRRDVLVHHTLLADEAALLNDCLSAYSHSVLVRGNESIEMGKATLKGQPIRYKIELIPGGLEVLHKKKKKAYPLKRPMRDLMLSTTREMEAAGVGFYNDPNFDAEFASPVFFVYNKAKYRLVCDYKDLNSVTKDSIYPLPHMDYIFENLGKSNDVGGKPTHFSILDLKSGYWQIPLEELSQKLAAVLLPTGIFRFICLPFGLKNAPAFFQRYMDQVLSEGLGNFCFVYIDDIVIFSNSFDSHIEHLNLVLQMLKESNLKCNVEKCHFCLSQLRVLGKVISGEGIAPDPDLIHAMVSFPSPGLDIGNLAKKKLKRFIAMVGYYRHHIKNFGSLTSDLSKLLRDDYVWDSSSWTQLEEACFQNLKQQLLSSPLLLEYPDFNKEFFLQSDASKVGAGAVLFQLDSLGRRCVVSYASWLFNDTERRYNTTERELLGLILSVRKWKPFFYHTKFYAETDHQPLVGYLKLSDPYGKIARWAAELQQFNFTIKYIKGETNIPADTLSRTSEEVDFLETIYSCDIEEVDRFTSKYRPSKVLAKAFSTDEVEVCTLLEETEEVILLNKLNYSLPSVEEWCVAQKEDVYFGPYVAWILEKRLPLDKYLALEIARLADHYALDSQGILVYSSSLIKDNINLSFRKCVPAKFRKIILSECHDSLWSGGHLGRDKTLDKVRSLYYFPRMDQFINLWVKSCPICLATKRKHPSSLVVPLGTIEVSSVWDLVSIDIWDAGVLSNRGNRYLLTVIDGFSKYAFAIPLKNKTAKTVASKLYKHVFSQFGYPKRLHSDNGTEFCNSVLKELCEYLDIHKTHTTVYHPQGNAYAERIHQFFKNALTAFVNQDQRNWDLLIPALINVYLTTVHTALGGFSPSQVAFGRTFNTPTVRNCDEVDLSNSTISYALKVKFVLDRVQKVVSELLKEKAVKNLKISEDKEKLSYSVGDKVGLLVEAKPSNVKSAKLFPRYSGPHRIVKITKDSKVIYLQDPQGKLKTHPVSISNVKPWPSRQVLLEEFDKYELIRNQKRNKEAKRGHISVSKTESKKDSVSEEELDIMGNPIYPVDSPLRNAKVKVSVEPDDTILVPYRMDVEYDIMGNPIEEDVDFLEPMIVDGDLPPLEREIVQVQAFLLDEIIVYKVRSTRLFLGASSDNDIVYNNDFNICFIA